VAIQGQKFKQLKPCWNFKEVEPIIGPGSSTPNFELNIFLLGFPLTKRYTPANAKTQGGRGGGQSSRPNSLFGGHFLQVNFGALE